MVVIKWIVDRFSWLSKNAYKVIINIDISVFNSKSFRLVLYALLNLLLFFLRVFFLGIFSFFWFLDFLGIFWLFCNLFFWSFLYIRIFFFGVFIICRSFILENCINEGSDILKTSDSSFKCFILVICVDIEVYVICWNFWSVVDVRKNVVEFCEKVFSWLVLAFTILTFLIFFFFLGFFLNFWFRNIVNMFFCYEFLHWNISITHVCVGYIFKMFPWAFGYFSHWVFLMLFWLFHWSNCPWIRYSILECILILIDWFVIIDIFSKYIRCHFSLFTVVLQSLIDFLVFTSSLEYILILGDSIICIWFAFCNFRSQFLFVEREFNLCILEFWLAWFFPCVLDCILIIVDFIIRILSFFNFRFLFFYKREWFLDVIGNLNALEHRFIQKSLKFDIKISLNLSLILFQGLSWVNYRLGHLSKEILKETFLKCVEGIWEGIQWFRYSSYTCQRLLRDFHIRVSSDLSSRICSSGFSVRSKETVFEQVPLIKLDCKFDNIVIRSISSGIKCFRSSISSGIFCWSFRCHGIFLSISHFSRSSLNSWSDRWHTISHRLRFCHRGSIYRSCSWILCSWCCSSNWLCSLLVRIINEVVCILFDSYISFIHSLLVSPILVTANYIYCYRYEIAGDIIFSIGISSQTRKWWFFQRKE